MRNLSMLTDLYQMTMMNVDPAPIDDAARRAFVTRSSIRGCGPSA